LHGVLSSCALLPEGAGGGTGLSPVDGAHSAQQRVRQRFGAPEEARGQRRWQVVLRDAAKALHGGAVRQNRLGGENRLDRLLRVERAQQDRGRCGTAVPLLLGAVFDRRQHGCEAIVQMGGVFAGRHRAFPLR
jgi:hypothetical protein